MRNRKLKKKCDDTCLMFRLYTKVNLLTHNGCGNCEHRESFEIAIKDYWESKENDERTNIK